jgi:outer membrane protein TolC
MFYPNLSLQANLGQQAFRPDFLLQFPTSLAYMAAAGISGPLVNRKALKAGYSMARARKMQALAEFHHVSNEAYLEVSGLLALEQSLREAWTVKSREVAILQSSRELAISLFAAGSATYLEVVLSQQQVLNAERQRVHLQKAFLQNQICLYKAVGGGVL